MKEAFGLDKDHEYITLSWEINAEFAAYGDRYVSWNARTSFHPDEAEQSYAEYNLTMSSLLLCWMMVSESYVRDSCSL